MPYWGSQTTRMWHPPQPSHLTSARPDVEIARYEGGEPGYLLLIGVG